MEDLPSSSGSFNWFKTLTWGFVLLLLVGVGVSGYFLGSRSAAPYQCPQSCLPQPAVKDGEKTTSWKKPVSNQKGLPILADKDEGKGSLLIYSLTSEKVNPTDKIVVGQGGTSGLGESNPLSSPDLLYTAYIEKASLNLFLLSNDTLEAKQITAGGGVRYISGWSPNSQKIIYYVQKDTITSQTEGMGGPPEKVNFSPKLDSGFFLFNIDSGETKKLYPVEYFEEFIDNDRLLVRTTDSYYKGHLVVFDVNTFEANYTFVKEEFGFGAGQFNFTPDGKKWVYLLSRNPTTDANIIYTLFPAKEGEEVETGKWGELNFPVFSPSGTKIAYFKEGSVWVYNLTTKEKKGYIKALLTLLWINEGKLLTRDYDPSQGKWLYYLLDLASGISTQIY